MTTPDCVPAPPTVAAMVTSPAPRPWGTTRLIWYSPAPDNPAKDGVTLTLLMRRPTALVVDADPENGWPASSTGLVGPNPTP